jgi:hypothetical protein
LYGLPFRFIIGQLLAGSSHELAKSLFEQRAAAIPSGAKTRGSPTTEGGQRVIVEVISKESLVELRRHTRLEEKGKSARELLTPRCAT